MSQLKPYEGPDAEELIEQVRRELGPDAKIVSGETRRVGGVLGFFSKEQLRLYAEVPGSDLPRPEMPGPKALAPKARRRLAETVPIDVFATLAEETADRNDVASTPPRRPGTVAPIPAPFASVSERPTEPIDFEAVLRDVAQTIEDEPTMNHSLALSELSAPESASTVIVESAPIVGPGPIVESAPIVGPGPIVESAPIVLPVPETVATGLHFRGDGRHAATASAFDPGASVPSPTQAAAGNPVTDPRPLDALARDGELAEALWSTGLRRSDATAVAARVADGADLSVILTQLFVRLAPPSPPLRPAASRRLVIVGSAVHADRLALDLSGECDVSSEATAFADATTEERYGAAVILALDAPVTSLRLERQRRALAALHPATVVGVVDAVVKTGDIFAWAEDLGGVDVLALVDVAATRSPAAVLRIGVPVARLDGHAASPARWAATVIDLIELGR